MATLLPVDPEVAERVERLDLPFNRYGIDPYGVDRRALARFFTALRFFAYRYNRVDVHGVEHIPDGAAMLVGNHSGGVALDGGVVLATCFFEREPPRLAQGMVDKFVARLPGAGPMASKVGQFTGLPQHAERLLCDGRLLMVFPEGARGTAKLAHQAHTLVRFGTGFVRLALRASAPVVPMAFLGAGEAFPTVANLPTGGLMGIPYIPVPRWLLAVPRPTRFQLLFGAPMRLSGTGNEDDATIEELVQQVRRRIAYLLQQGQALRDGTLRPDELDLEGDPR